MLAITPSSWHQTRFYTATYTYSSSVLSAFCIQEQQLDCVEHVGKHCNIPVIISVKVSQTTFKWLLTGKTIIGKTLESTIHDATLLHEICCSQKDMYFCCSALETFVYSWTHIVCAWIHEVYNTLQHFHETMLHDNWTSLISIQHVACNLVAHNISTYTMQQTCIVYIRLNAMLTQRIYQ